MQAVLSMLKSREGDRVWLILPGVRAAGNTCANNGNTQPGIGIAFHDTADDKTLLSLQVCVPLATFVLPVAVADAQSMAEAVEKIEAVLNMPLLLRAVCSKSVPLVSDTHLALFFHAHASAGLRSRLGH